VRFSRCSSNWVTSAVVVINRTRLPWLHAAKPGGGQVRLAGAGIANQQDIFLLRDVFTAQQLPDQWLVDRGLRPEVKTVDGLEDRELGLLDPALGGPPLPINQLPFRQPQQVLGIVAPFLGAHRRHAGVVAQQGRQLQRLEMMFQQQNRGIFAHGTRL